MGQHGPTVDVGIPTRGERAFIVDAIESVFAQTVPSWRLVIGENGPGDPAFAEMLAPYVADPRVHHVVRAEPVSAARNHTLLLRAGTAPYVALLHDDDRWSEQFLERRVAFLDSHPQCGYVFSGHMDIDGDGRVTARHGNLVPEGAYPPSRVLPLLLEHNVVGIPTVLVRRSAYDAVGAEFDERFSDMFDWEMWLRLASRFHVGYLAECDAYYRVHAGQLSRRARWGEQRLLLLDLLDDRLSAEPALAPTRSAVRSRRASALLTAALDAFENGERGPGLEYARAAVRAQRRRLLDARIALVLACAATGSAGLPLVRAMRRANRRRRPRLRAYPSHRGR